MKLFNLTTKNFIFLLAPVSFFLLASCGSYQYSGYEDGIYGETNRTYERQNQNATQDGNSSYYKNLFAEEAALYGEVLTESTIFTDVDSYSSAGNYDPESDQAYNYQGGHAPWGNDPDSYTINIYNHGFYGGFYHPYYSGFYAFDPFWGPGYYGPSWYRPGFYGPYGPRYWGSSWSIGFGGFNYGHWGYGYGGYYPYGYGGWYSPHYYHGSRYPISRRNVAYNTGRREAISSYSRNTSAVRNATILENRGRTSSYSRSIRSIRGSNDDYGLTRRAVSRTYDPRRSAEYNNSNTVNRRSSNSVYSRNQVPTRQQNTSTMRTSSPTQNSGAVRTSGNSGRSSSSGTSPRGRGN